MAIRVKLFTHTDLDGVGCTVVLKHYYPYVDAVYCEYDEINESINNFIRSDEHKNYDFVYITDIYVNERIADLINEKIAYKTHLIDHHTTAEWLNQYHWAKVIPSYVRGKTSATSLLLDYLQTKRNLPSQTLGHLVIFAETVRRYDTWEWKTVYNDQRPKDLNDFLYAVGRNTFINRFLRHPYPSLDSHELDLAESARFQINEYINKKLKQVHVLDVPLIEGNKHKIAVVFAERNISELGDAICEAYPDIDFAMIFSLPNKVSFRTLKDNVPVNTIAQLYGGGGHPKAAGAPFSYEKFALVLKQVLGSKDSNQ